MLEKKFNELIFHKVYISFLARLYLYDLLLNEILIWLLFFCHEEIMKILKKRKKLTLSYYFVSGSYKNPMPSYPFINAMAE